MVAPASSLYNILLDFLLQLDWVCTNNLIDLLSILENHESWHSANSVLLSEVREIIDIDFQVSSVGILFGEFNDPGSDGLTC